MNDDAFDADDLLAWKNALVDDLKRVSARDRWGLALMAVGWVHLAFFLVNQLLFSRHDPSDAHFVGLWVLEVAAVVGTVRLVAGRGWYRATPLAGVIARVWATFLILAFSAATLNSLFGASADWFKLVWCTLSSFGFATTAWLLSPWFLVSAFQMYFTGLLMVAHPGWAYLIHGVSWCLALQGIGLVLEWRRIRGLFPAAGSAAEPLVGLGVGAVPGDRQ
ncbi:MAG TPA: hypothetical protein VF590_08435 [Isosphaeraceae bacterium]